MTEDYYNEDELNQSARDSVDEQYYMDEYKKIERAGQKLMRQRMNTYAQQMINEGVQEALKEAGISPEEYNQFIYSDPELNARTVKKTARKHTLKMINKARQRDSKGRFVSQGQGQPERMQQGQPQQGRQPLDSEQLKAKYADQKRKGTNDEVRAMVDDMLADMF